jgi:hypothetical protein
VKRITLLSLLPLEGRTVASLVEAQCYKRKVENSIPDEVVGFFNLLTPSSLIMALGSTQPLTEMSTRNPPGV